MKNRIWTLVWAFYVLALSLALCACSNPGRGSPFMLAAIIFAAASGLILVVSGVYKHA